MTESNITCHGRAKRPRRSFSAGRLQRIVQNHSIFNKNGKDLVKRKNLEVSSVF